MNATNPDKAKKFIKNNGVIDHNSIHEPAIADAPDTVKSAWAQIKKADLAPFAIPLKRISGCRRLTQELLENIEDVSGMDIAALKPRFYLTYRLTQYVQAAELAIVDKGHAPGPNLALVVVPRAIHAAVAQAVLGEVSNPQIRACSRRSREHNPGYGRMEDSLSVQAVRDRQQCGSDSSRGEDRTG